MKRILSVIFLVLFSLVLISCVNNNEPTLDEFIVIFVDYDDTVLKQERVEEGASATAPDNPTRAGYTFDKWDKTFSNVTSDLTVKALYVKDEDPAPTTYTVKFLDHDDTVLKEETVEEGASATAPNNPTRAGYTFDKWDKTFSNVTSDLTVKALYIKDEDPAPTTYTVKFLDHDDTVLKEETVEEGAAATAPDNPTRVGYTFDKWDTLFNNVKANIEIKPIYNLITYSITYIVENDQINLNTITSYTVETSSFKFIDAIYENYVFLGWFDDEDNKVTEIPTNSPSNLTLTAKFSEEEYRIIYKEYMKELNKIDEVYFPYFIADDTILMLMEDMLIDITTSFQPLGLTKEDISFVEIDYGLPTSLYAVHIKNDFLNQLIIITNNIYGTVRFNEDVSLDYINIFNENTYHIYANGYKDLYTIVESNNVDFSLFGSENAFEGVKETNKFNLATNELFDASLIKGSKIIITTNNNRFYDADLFILDNKDLDFSKNISETNNIQLLGENTSVYMGERLTHVFNNNILKTEEFKVTLNLDSDDKIIKVFEALDVSIIITNKNRHFITDGEVLIEIVLPTGEVADKIGIYYNRNTDDEYSFVISKNKKTFVVDEKDFENSVIELVEQDITLGSAKLIDYYYYNYDYMYFLFDDGTILDIDDDAINNYLVAEEIKLVPGETIELPTLDDILMFEFLYWTYYDENKGEYIKVDEFNSIKDDNIRLVPYYEAKLNVNYNGEVIELTLENIDIYIYQIYDLVHNKLNLDTNNFEIYLDSEYQELLVNIKDIKGSELYVKVYENEEEDNYYDVYLDGSGEYRYLNESEITKTGLNEAFNINLSEDVIWYYFSNYPYYEWMELNFDNLPLENRLEITYKIVKTIKVFVENEEYEFVYLKERSETFDDKMKVYYDFELFLDENIGNSNDYFLFDENGNLVLYAFALKGNEAHLHHKSNLEPIYINNEEIYLLPNSEGKIYLPDLSLINQNFYNYEDDEGNIYNAGDEIEPGSSFIHNYAISYELITEEGEILSHLIYNPNQIVDDVFQLFLDEISNYHIVEFQGREFFENEYMYDEFYKYYTGEINSLVLEVYDKDIYNKVTIVTMDYHLDYVIYIKKNEPLVNSLKDLVDFKVIGLVDEEGEKVDLDKVPTEAESEFYTVHLVEVNISSRNTWQYYNLGKLEISYLNYQEVIKDALEKLGFKVYGEIDGNYSYDRYYGEFYNQETEFLVEVINYEYGNSSYYVFSKGDNNFEDEFLGSNYYLKDELGNLIRLTSNNYEEEDMVIYDIRWAYIEVTLNIDNEVYKTNVYYNRFEEDINKFVSDNFSDQFIIEIRDANNNILTEEMLYENIYLEANLTLGSKNDYVIIIFISDINGYKEIYLEKDEEGFATLPEYNYDGLYSEFFDSLGDENNDLYVPGTKINENKTYFEIFKTTITIHYDNKTIELPEFIFEFYWELNQYVVEYLEDFDNEYYILGLYLDQEFSERALDNKIIFDNLYLDAILVSEYIEVEILDHYNSVIITYVKKGEGFNIVDKSLENYMDWYNVVGFVDSDNNVVDESYIVVEPIKLYPIYYINQLEYYDRELNEDYYIKNLEISVLDYKDKIVAAIGREDRIYIFGDIFQFLIEYHYLYIGSRDKNDYVILTTINDEGYSSQQFISKNELLINQYDYYLFEKDENDKYILFDSYQYLTENITLYRLEMQIDLMFGEQTVTQYLSGINDEPVERRFQRWLEWEGYYATSFTITNGGSIEDGRLIGTTNHVIIAAEGFNSYEGYMIEFYGHDNLYVKKDEEGKAYFPEPPAYYGEYKELFIGWEGYKVGDEIDRDYNYFYPEFKVTYEINYDDKIMTYEATFKYYNQWDIYYDIYSEIEELGYYIIGIYSDQNFEFDFDPFVETVYVDALLASEYIEVKIVDHYNSSHYIHIKKGEEFKIEDEQILEYIEMYNVVYFVDNGNNVIDSQKIITESIDLYPVYYVDHLGYYDYELNYDFYITNLKVTTFDYKDKIVNAINNHDRVHIVESEFISVIEGWIYINSRPKSEYVVLTIIEDGGNTYQVFINKRELLKDEFRGYLFEKDKNGDFILFDSYQQITENITLYSLEIQIDLMFSERNVTQYLGAINDEPVEKYFQEWLEWEGYYATSFTVTNGGSIEEGRLVGTTNHVIISVEGFSKDEGYKIEFYGQGNLYVKKDEEGKAYFPEPPVYEGEYHELFIGWQYYNVGDEIYNNYNYFYPEFKVNYQVFYNDNQFEYEGKFSIHDTWSLTRSLSSRLEELGYYIVEMYSDSEFVLDFDPFIETIYVDVKEIDAFNPVWVQTAHGQLKIFLEKEQPVSSLLDNLEYNVVGFVDEYGEEVPLDSTLDGETWLYPVYYVEIAYVINDWGEEEGIINDLYISGPNFKKNIFERLKDYDYYYEINTYMWELVVNNQIYVIPYSKEDYKQLIIVREWDTYYYLLHEEELVIEYSHNILFELIDGEYVFFDPNQTLTSDKTLYAPYIEIYIFYLNGMREVRFHDAYYYNLEIDYIKSYLGDENKELTIISGGEIVDGFIKPTDFVIEIGLS